MASDPLGEAVLEQSRQVMRQALGMLVNFGLLYRDNQWYEVSHALIHTFAAEYLLSQKYITPALSRETVQIWHNQLVTTLLRQIEQTHLYDVKYPIK